MAAPLIAGLPPNLNLPSGYQIRFAALDPTDGSAVSGVNVVNATLYVQSDTSGPLAALQNGPFMLLPGPGN